MWNLAIKPSQEASFARYAPLTRPWSGICPCAACRACGIREPRCLSAKRPLTASDVARQAVAVALSQTTSHFSHLSRVPKFAPGPQSNDQGLEGLGFFSRLCPCNPARHILLSGTSALSMQCNLLAVIHHTRMWFHRIPLEDPGSACTN